MVNQRHADKVHVGVYIPKALAADADRLIASGPWLNRTELITDLLERATAHLRQSGPRPSRWPPPAAGLLPLDPLTLPHGSQP